MSFCFFLKESSPELYLPVIKKRENYIISSIPHSGLLFFSGGHSNHFITKEINVYNYFENKWDELLMSQARENMAVVSYAEEKLLFVAGGYTQKGVTDQIDIFDLHNNKIEQVHLHISRYDLSGLVLPAKKLVFFAGGIDIVNGILNYRNNIDIYDVKTRSFTQSFLSTPRSEIVTVVLQKSNLVFFGGGKNNNGIVRIVDIYDVENDKFSYYLLSKSYLNLGATVLNDFVFYGGIFIHREKKCGVDIFNHTEKKWTFRLLTSCSEKFNIISSNYREIVFFGGEDTGFEIFEPKINQWKIIHPTLKMNHFLSHPTLKFENLNFFQQSIFDLLDQSTNFECGKGNYCLLKNFYLMCPPGNYCPENSINPIQCPKDTFNHFTGQWNISSCLPCEKWQHCPVGSENPVECEMGYLCVDGITVSTCPPGTYWDKYCQPCPSGFFCQGGNETMTECPDGFWCPKATLKPIECSNGNYCQRGSSEEIKYLAGKKFPEGFIENDKCPGEMNSFLSFIWNCKNRFERFENIFLVNGWISTAYSLIVAIILIKKKIFRFLVNLPAIYRKYELITYSKKFIEKIDYNLHNLNKEKNGKKKCRFTMYDFAFIHDLYVIFQNSK